MISADFNNIFAYKSLDAAGTSDPFFSVYIGNRSNGNMYLTLGWWCGLTVEGQSTVTCRDDVKIESLGQRAALAEAPSAVSGHFQVPKVL